jgi:hypothetical protein
MKNPLTTERATIFPERMFLHAYQRHQRAPRRPFVDRLGFVPGFYVCEPPSAFTQGPSGIGLDRAASGDPRNRFQASGTMKGKSRTSKNPPIWDIITNRHRHIVTEKPSIDPHGIGFG